MQVDVHGVDAEVARPHLADDGVEVRAVAVEIRPDLVQRLRDLDDLRLEQAAGVRVRQHDRRDVGSEQRAHVVDMDPAIVPDRHRLYGEADQRRGRRIGAVRRIRHQHRPARIALALGGDRRLDRHHAEKLAMGAGLRRERNGRHGGQRREIAGELAHELERALQGRDRLQGMNVADARQPRHALVEAGIVLHGAGAERKQPGVDAEVLLRQAHVMPHGLGLGEPGQADVALALEPAETLRERLRLVEIDAGRVEAADLEDQRLLLLQRAVAGEGRVLGGARVIGAARAALAVQHIESRSLEGREEACATPLPEGEADSAEPSG